MDKNTIICRECKKEFECNIQSKRQFCSKTCSNRSTKRKTINIDYLIQLKREGKTNNECVGLIGVNTNIIGKYVNQLINENKIEKQKKIPWNKDKRSKEIEVSCQYCNKKFKIYECKYNSSKNKIFYCDKKCEAEGKRKNHTINQICKYCGDRFKTTNTTQKYCSNKCKNDSFNPQLLLKNQKEKYPSKRRSKVLVAKWSKDKENMLQKRNTNEYKAKIGASMREVFSSREFRLKHAQKCKEGWTPKKKQKQREMALKRTNNKRITIPNLIVADYLRFIGVEYKMEQPIGDICQVDILLKEKKKGIEIFGDYWHANPMILDLKKTKKLTHDQETNTFRDIQKKHRLEKEYPDYEILYLWEGDISFKWGKCRQKLLDLIGEKEPEIKMNDYKINQINFDKARMFCQKYHYLGKSFPMAPRKIYGLFYSDILVGVAVYCNVGAKNAGKVVGNNVCELSRFCLYDYLPKNTASYFLSRTIHLIKKDIKGLDGLISYSDNSLHQGTIYRATNWQEFGEVSGSYYYLTPHGQKINRRKVYKHCSAFSISESEYSLRMDLQKIETSSKTKFIYIFK